MALIDDVREVCQRLAPHGWQKLLDHHGLDIEAEDLEQELRKELPAIDRRIEGFGDFASEGRRGIEPGQPARSLLYHALASPNVLSGVEGEPLAAFPTLAEIEAVENYVFGVEPPSVDDLVARFPRESMAIAVFASEYRPGADTVHRRHADLCFSRTGVARVGTSKPLYEGRARGFLPFVGEDDHAFRVLPARYAAYVAVQLSGQEELFGPMNFDLLRTIPTPLRQRFLEEGAPAPEDGNRLFWVPVHKLFSGRECVRGLDLSVTLQAHHTNEKIRRVHLQLRRRRHDTGWLEPDIGNPPFVFTEGIAEFSRDPDHGEGVLTPAVHEKLVEPAEYRGEPLWFLVPPQIPPDEENPWAPSFQIRSERGFRRAPEYVHVRHEVKEDGTVEDLNDLEDVAGRVRAGRYRALHYLDFTGDGGVEALCPQLAVELPRAVPAYSIVTAPDFYPLCGQRELIEWYIQRVPTALRERIWHERLPLTLADARFPPNLQLKDIDFRREDNTVTAIVSLPEESDAAERTLVPSKTVRHAHLPDAAASIFAPGWDTSLDEISGFPHLASYGLGSPFPEDAKLCAALSSFWPAVAPDAGRSFSVSLPTATPLTDEEIGSAGDLPWDGIPGPRPASEGNKASIEYTSFAHADYVRSALDDRFSLALTGRVDFTEYAARILAVARAYKVSGIHPRDRRWRLLSFRALSPGDEELREAEEEARTGIEDARYRIAFVRAREPRRHPTDHTKVLVDIDETLTLFAGALPRVLIKRPSMPWRVERAT